jgi:hypothetical protein
MPRSYSKEQSTRHSEREKKEPKPKKPIKKVSEKRLKENAQYTTLRFMFLTKNNKCQICSIATAQHVHHKYSGKDRAKYYLDVSTWMALCICCHNEIHAKPSESREKGHLY